MGRKITAILGAAALLAAGGLLFGCSSSGTAKAPGLSQAALDQLMARQRMRSKPPDMAKKKLNAKAQEKQGQRGPPRPTPIPLSGHNNSLQCRPEPLQLS